MKHSEVFAKAADIIEKRGMCTQAYQIPDGSVCVATAIYYGAGGAELFVGKYVFNLDLMDEVYTKEGHIQVFSDFVCRSVESFNNVICKDKYEAGEVLRAAAKHYADKGE